MKRTRLSVLREARALDEAGGLWDAVKRPIVRVSAHASAHGRISVHMGASGRTIGGLTGEVGI